MRPGCVFWALAARRELDGHGLVGNGLDRLLLAGQPVLAGADHSERPRSEVRIRADREPADRVPAEPFDLERIHLDRHGWPLAGAVVVVDRLRDRLEVLDLGRAHRDAGWPRISV